MEKRYESDMTRKDKWDNEIKKMKAMSFKEKIEYIWTYYKSIFVILLVIAMVISMGMTMYHNANKIELLSIAVVDMDIDKQQQVDLLEADLLERLGTGDKNDAITMDTSASSIEDYNAVMKMMVLLGTGTTDLFICNDTIYDRYEDQEAFLTWEEILGDEYSKYEQYMTDGKLDLTKCKNWEKYNMVYYEPVYAAVLASTKKQENCVKFLELMTE